MSIELAGRKGERVDCSYVLCILRLFYSVLATKYEVMEKGADRILPE